MSSPLLEHLKQTLCHLPVILALAALLGWCLILIIGYRVKIRYEDLPQYFMLEIIGKYIIKGIFQMFFPGNSYLKTYKCLKSCCTPML